MLSKIIFKPKSLSSLSKLKTIFLNICSVAVNIICPIPVAECMDTVLFLYCLYNVNEYIFNSLNQSGFFNISKVETFELSAVKHI